MEEKKSTFRETLYKKLDIDPTLLPKGILVEIRDRFSVTVRGCGKILTYTPENIKLSIDRGALSICGQDLVCTSYFLGAVGVEGKITSVSFEEEQ